MGVDLILRDMCRWQAKFRAFGLRIGYVGHYCWAFLFFPVTRASTILPLVGLTSESSIKYHIWLGHVSNFCFLVHTVVFLIYWAMVNKLMEVRVTCIYLNLILKTKQNKTFILSFIPTDICFYDFLYM